MSSRLLPPISVSGRVLPISHFEPILAMIDSFSRNDSPMLPFNLFVSAVFSLFKS